MEELKLVPTHNHLKRSIQQDGGSAIHRLAAALSELKCSRSAEPSCCCCSATHRCTVRDYSLKLYLTVIRTTIQSVPLDLGPRVIVGLLDSKGKRETQENKATLNRGVRKVKKAIVATLVTKPGEFGPKGNNGKRPHWLKKGEGRKRQSWQRRKS